VATPGELGRPGDLPVPVGQQLRRWGALLALAGLALPGVSADRQIARRPAVVKVLDAGHTQAGGAPARSSRNETAPGSGIPGGLQNGDAGDVSTPATAAPWAAGVVEADGKPLPTAPPPGPVPVDGTPQPASASPATGTSGPAATLVPPEREYLRPILTRYAQENGLPADLVMAVAWVESSWRPNAESDAGAVGVMQLMPDTVGFVSRKLLGLRSDLDPWNATSNVRMGTRFLRHLLDEKGGNVRQALIAYNQGLTSLDAKGSYGAAERYADRVLALRSQFRSP
jgi:hypothetical protein